MSSFRNMLSSYFDELTSIVDEQKKQKEEGMDVRDDRPYSSLLTQDEEPSGEANPSQVDEPEPEVIVRGS
jgi:hypothetical protein